ncbi:hypothetical protein FHY18_000440 [Xanthomonas arboricola]|uniref:hypothetical protein n=1 Tax=Xanthomonas sp. 3793 TaxID=3035312 RepID=UPI00216A558D|nr:hypothetical protein [Xanthomonas sp. 3793]MCS3744910.1 hypothetical protein [Xanthomonas sp. 3793]
MLKRGVVCVLARFWGFKTEQGFTSIGMFWIVEPKAELSRPSGASHYFLCLCKEKVTKKKAHPVLAPCAPSALRVRKSGRNFCKGHPCPLQKRRASMRAALRVVSAGLAAVVWGPGKAQAKQGRAGQSKARQALQLAPLEGAAMPCAGQAVPGRRPEA